VIFNHQRIIGGPGAALFFFHFISCPALLKMVDEYKLILQKLSCGQSF